MQDMKLTEQTVLRENARHTNAMQDVKRQVMNMQHMNMPDMKLADQTDDNAGNEYTGHENERQTACRPMLSTIFKVTLTNN